MRKTFLAIIILMLCVTGCSKVDSRFVGDWQSERIPTTFSIFEDGTGTYNNQPCSVEIGGKYIAFEFKDGDSSVKMTDERIVIELKDGDRSATVRHPLWAVNDTSMVLGVKGVGGTVVFRKQ